MPHSKMEEGVAAPTLSIIAVLLSGGPWGRQEAISTAIHLCLDTEALIDRLAYSAAGEMNLYPHISTGTHTDSHSCSTT